jgi:hypothetical protein
MSSVLHPVGPEPPQTYWIRRVLVLASAILVVAVVAGLIMAQTNSAAVSASPTPVATSASTTASGSATPRPSAAAAKQTTRSQAKPKPAPASVQPPAKPTRVPVPDCRGEELRATLTGKGRLKTGKPNTFEISLINGSGQTCRVTVTRASFELKIYSGKDRIWSSDDCTKAVKKITKKVKAERAVAWKMKWDGRRSRENCKRRPEMPRAGTYYATAQFKGAKPVQLRMILR